MDVLLTSIQLSIRRFLSYVLMDLAMSELYNVCYYCHFKNTSFIFLFLMGSYLYDIAGTQNRKKKYQMLQKEVFDALHNSPRPGPATYAVHCLHAPSYIDASQGFCDIVLCALNNFVQLGTIQADISKAKELAAYLFMNIVREQVELWHQVAVQLLEVVGFRLIDVEKAICGTNATAALTQHIIQLTIYKSNFILAALVKHFSMHKFGEYVFLKMIREKKLAAAKKWATCIGEKSILCRLINEYFDMNMFDEALGIIRNNNFMPYFPDVQSISEERSILALVRQGLWKNAEDQANNDSHLISFLVYLAMESGFIEKVEELCNQYSLGGFDSARDPVIIFQSGEHLSVADFGVYEIVWVDSVNCLRDATSKIEACKVVAIDSEWKELQLGSSSVCILQISSTDKVFIFDTIKLHNSAPDELDRCLNRILCSPNILKLGYNIRQDMRQIAYSFGQLGSSKHYRMLFDFQVIFPSVIVGLGGIAKKTLGVDLLKNEQESDWTHRPLSPYQVEYAALDVLVLMYLFQDIRFNPENQYVSKGGITAVRKSAIIPFYNVVVESREKGPQQNQDLDSKVLEDLILEDLAGCQG